jgi:hypothetical protein
MAHTSPVKLRLACMIALGLAAGTGMAQSKPSDAKQRQSAEGRKYPKPEVPETKSRSAGNALQQPLTLTQVERATGGQVIGARKIMVQGRRLNQIKLKMPDGRIIIYSRLFDEFGRSVDTVESIEAVDGPETRSAQQ